MIRRPPRSTRPYTLLPDTTLCRSDGNFSFDGRLARISSDGYVDRGASNLQSFFVSGAWHGRHSLLRANVFGGKEKTYQAWYGTPESRLTGDVAAMEAYAADDGLTPEETENLLNADRKSVV